MRSFAAAALMGIGAVSAYSISDYIMAADRTPANALDSSSPTNALGMPSDPAVERCGAVSDFLAKTKGTIVDPKLAYECLQTVPLDKEGGLVELDGLEVMVSFQSTLSYLKDPPAGYPYPAVDIEAGLAAIRAKLLGNGYTNEYDFQLDIYTLISKARDGHFNYVPDIVNAFGFLRNASVFSLSKDGLAVPELWYGGPINDPVAFGSSSGPMASITHINGQDTESWLNAYADRNGGNQDPDANYNSLFPNVPSLASSPLGGFSSSLYYQGQYTTLTFADSTTYQINNTAVTTLNFTGVRDGKTFFEKFCTGSPPPKPGQAGPSTPETPFLPIKPGTEFKAPFAFPAPLIQLGDKSLAGYFSDENPDLAILSIPSFEPNDPILFSDAVRTFLATAQKADKKRLLIDLRGNPGGIVPLAYDLFTQLFPKLYPYGGTNFRATPLVHAVGNVVSNFYSNVTDQTATDDDCTNDYSLPLLDFKTIRDQNLKPFNSYDDFFGPIQIHGDNFTNIDRIDVDDFFSSFCTQISDHGNLTGITPQVFQPEDVVIVQDGACASTCTVFTEFMKTQAGVKQIVFGGRAQVGPMQGVGGVKGANVYDFKDIVDFLSEAFDQDNTPADHINLNQTYGYIFPAADQVLLRVSVSPDGPSSHVNVRNNIRQGDDTVTPLQFVYEAADCRLFYTPKQIFDQELVWSAAYDARWNNATCVAGSTGQPSAESGYVGLGGPVNSTGTTNPSNGTGIWSSTTATSTFGSQKTPTASPTSTITPSDNGAASSFSVGTGFALLSTLAGMMML